MSAPLSVVVPVLEDAGRIGPLLGDLSEGLMEALVADLVIADGGSTDAIAEIAEEVGATLVTAPRGRGAQIAAGCRAARGRWLLILHADTRLPAGWSAAVARHIREAPEDAGYFHLSFDSKATMARVTAGWANLRARLFGLPYGDQGLLVPRDHYDRIGGCPEIPLMEDVAMARALGRRRLRSLGATVTTSAERYETEGWLRRGGRNLLTLTRYMLGTPPERLAAGYGARRRDRT